MSTTKTDRARELAENLARHAASAEKIGNAEEAATFAAKAAAIADKFGFDVPDGTFPEDQYVSDRWGVPVVYEMPFVGILAEMYGVASFRWNRRSNEGFAQLHGKANSIELVKSLFLASRPALASALKYALSERSKKFLRVRNSIIDMGISVGVADKHAKKEVGTKAKFCRDFYIGVAIGFRTRIREAREAYNAGMMSVVLAESERAAADYSKRRENEGKSIGKSRTKTVNSDAFAAGKNAASGVQSGTGIGGSTLMLD